MNISNLASSVRKDTNAMVSEVRELVNTALRDSDEFLTTDDETEMVRRTLRAIFKSFYDTIDNITAKIDSIAEDVGSELTESSRVDRAFIFSTLQALDEARAIVINAKAKLAVMEIEAINHEFRCARKSH